MSEQFFTPPQAAKVLGVTADKVIGWINSGELVASNLAADPNGERPRWRIGEDDLGKFLIRRRHAAASQSPKRNRRRQSSDVVKHF